MGFTAWADVPPADVLGCNDKTEGADCKRDDGSAGACAKAACTRNDYSNGPPPKTVTYECLKCADKPAAPAPKVVEEKKTSCASVPGEALGVLALVLAARRKRA